MGNGRSRITHPLIEPITQIPETLAACLREEDNAIAAEAKLARYQERFGQLPNEE